MISFYPGPSRVYPMVARYLQDAAREGIMSINHRSEEFVSISKQTVTLLREKLGIPDGYSVYFVSSATESWEIIAQSLIWKESIHIFNGAFGKKWLDYTQKLKPEAKANVFDLQSSPEPTRFGHGELICLTQNETSNGTQVSEKTIGNFRRLNPDHLLAIDATSSMAGIQLDFDLADVWFASVQKCFGIPAGLGLLICSPEALKRAVQINERLHYNSLLLLEDMMQKYQTPNTPNVLGIYLLMRVMESAKPIEKISKMTVSRYKKWETFFDTKSDNLNLLAENKAVRSNTVLAIKATPDLVGRIKSDARKAGFLLGDGYGELKSNTFRIANFPALKRSEIARLMDFLYRFA